MTFLTPDTLLKPIKVVSTTFRTIRDQPCGQTAIGEYHGLNYSHTEPLERVKWEIIKEHKTEAEARAFHAKTVAGVSWDA